MNATSEPQRLPDGFINRGRDVTRLEAFVDAAFAFGMTLMVISLNSVPSDIPAMLAALKGVPTFAMSFIQIMIFWSAHATWSRRLGLDDASSRRLSLLLVFLMLIYVYPMKIMFGAFFAWISHDWLPPVASIHSLDDLKAMFVLYGIAFGTLSLCMAALYWQALRSPVMPPLEPAETILVRCAIVRWFYAVALAAGSIVFALLLPADVPNWLAGMPGMVYVLMSGTDFVVKRYARHARAAQAAG